MITTLSLLLFISVFQGIYGLVQTQFGLALGFALSSGIQVSAIMSLRAHRAEHGKLLWAVLSVWGCLILLSGYEQTTSLELHLLVILCSYFLLPLSSANRINILAWITLLLTQESSLQALHLTSTFTAAGIIICTNLVVKQISHMESEIAASHVTDKVTGCGNKEALLAEIEKAWAIYQRYNINAAVVRLHILKLPKLKEQLSEQQMNTLLTEIVQVWKSRLRNTDLLCRYDNEHFVCLLPNTKLDNAQHLAIDLCKACNDYEFSDNVKVSIESAVAQCDQENNWEGWLRNVGIK